MLPELIEVILTSLAFSVLGINSRWNFMVWMVMVARHMLELDAFTEEILFVGGNSAKDIRVK